MIDYPNKVLHRESDQEKLLGSEVARKGYPLAVLLEGRHFASEIKLDL